MQKNLNKYGDIQVGLENCQDHLNGEVMDFSIGIKKPRKTDHIVSLNVNIYKILKERDVPK